MRKGRSHLYEAAVILLAVTAFSVTSGHPFAFQVLTGAALLGFFFGGLIPIPRPLLLVFALIGGLVLFGNQPAPPGGHRFFIETLALPVYQVGLFLAIIAVVFLFRKNTPEESLFAICLALGVTAGAGVTYFVWPYAVFIVLQALFLGLYLRSDLPDLPKGFRSAVRVLLPFLLCLITAGALAACLGWTESKVNLLLSLSEPPLSGSSAFSSTTGLSSIRSMESGGRVVMRVSSQASATYLVGRVYVRYRNREWASLSKTQEIVPADAPFASGIFPPGRGTIFSLRQAVLSKEGWRPTFVERLDLVSSDGGTLFAPRDAELARANLPSLRRDEGGVLFFQPTSFFSGVYFLARGKARTGFIPEEKEMLDLCKALPPNLSPQVLRLARDVTRGRQTDEDKAQALETFFHNGFTYGKGYPFSGSSDPVEEFLFSRPPAHCEFFASGMALMLRSLGIPSRYVTGFLAQEWNGIGGYYTVRERDAHAWVEAYLPQRGWVSYDPTPPGALSGQRGGMLGQAREWLDWMSYQFQKLRAEVVGKNPKELLRLALDRLQALGRWLVEKPWRLGILFLLLLAENLISKKGALRGFLQRMERRKSQKDAPHIARLRACLRKVDAFLESRGRKRPGHLTLLEWSREVESLLAASEEKAIVERFLAAYSHIRYGMAVPVEGDLAELEGLAASLQSAQEKFSLKRRNG